LSLLLVGLGVLEKGDDSYLLLLARRVSVMKSGVVNLRLVMQYGAFSNARRANIILPRHWTITPCTFFPVPKFASFIQTKIVPTFNLPIIYHPSTTIIGVDYVRFCLMTSDAVELSVIRMVKLPLSST
jgi:hypothetical protein